MQQPSTGPAKPTPVWIQGPRLRQRWGISNSSFYEKLRKGLIPPAEYPFGPTKPYWRMEAIEELEATKTARVGRPPAAPEDRLIQRSIRLNEAQWAKLDALGMDWLRKLLDRTKTPKQ